MNDARYQMNQINLWWPHSELETKLMQWNQGFIYLFNIYICFKEKTWKPEPRNYDAKEIFMWSKAWRVRTTRISLYLALEKNSTTSFATETVFLKIQTPSLIDIQNLNPE